MARYWTSYWRGASWLENEEYYPVSWSGGTYERRGVTSGDIVYIVSVQRGQLFLGGKMQVHEIVSRAEAVRRRNQTDLYDAPEWLVGEQGSPLNLHRMLAPDLTRELRFISPDSEKGLQFKKNTSDLDEQTLRGVRELTPQSAMLLDEIINVTDAISHREEPIIVSRELLNQWSPVSDPGSFDFPEEITSSQLYEEGSVKQILVNRYERDVGARLACLRHRGTTCSACKADLATLYGRVASGLIHVHHLVSLAATGTAYRVDPINDLRPVCPNCHAVIHRRNPPYSIEEIQGFISANRRNRAMPRGKGDAEIP